MSDLYDDELPPREDPPRGSRDGMNEGVRILGAEEARASLGLGEPANAEPPEPEATIAQTAAEQSIDILLEPVETVETVEADKPLSESQAQELGKATGLILPRETTEIPVLFIL